MLGNETAAFDRLNLLAPGGDAKHDAMDAEGGRPDNNIRARIGRAWVAARAAGLTIC
jgi:hypothetical protein